MMLLGECPVIVEHDLSIDQPGLLVPVLRTAVGIVQTRLPVNVEVVVKRSGERAGVPVVRIYVRTAYSTQFQAFDNLVLERNIGIDIVIVVLVITACLEKSERVEVSKKVIREIASCHRILLPVIIIGRDTRGVWYGIAVHGVLAVVPVV